MSERKVLNKYFPPDFDPDLIPRRKVPKNSQQVVRLMAPFSMRCNTCGEYIYKGKKFNARKETVEGEDYYGIKIFRFYIKCTLCSAEITFKTDPKNTDYAAEHGASRNFEPWREEKAVEEEDRLAKLEEEENNPMKALENRTVDSKREMDILDALQDIRARNARNERVGQGVDLLARINTQEIEDEETAERERLEEEDEKLVREVFSKVAIPSGSETKMVTVKRKADDVEPTLQSLLPDSARQLITSVSLQPAAKKKKLEGKGKNALGIKVSLLIEHIFNGTRLYAINIAIDDNDLQDERDAILAHLSHFMDSTFLIAQANMRVNGQNFDSINAAGQDIEAFNEALDRRIWSLADTRLQWHKRMAKTRREVPTETQMRISTLYASAKEQDQAMLQPNEDEPMDEDFESEDETTPVQAEVAEEFHMTSAITQELDQNMPSQQERVQRAERATNQLRGLKY
ncbi:hypothetical protein NP233_g7971 [Leucocoprinus birnbaumii]|uniref:Splicing factor YJU2 n=1 Tax=Leucocoprinus birnbaumii TaxID=56174 RepID=A0AAD5VNB3_9AGAR|nr:hypothetical protein NP233_g7971 [Leucocoprinus birnbaumii]